MKEIPLTKGYVALVDDEDYEHLSTFKWSADVRSNAVYAIRCYRDANGKKRMMRMHRYILGSNEWRNVVDHINGIGTDNRRCNLRECSRTENARNRVKSAANSSGYKGVVYSKRIKKFVAHINNDIKMIHIGVFSSLMNAVCAYDIAAENFYGDFARLNFPHQGAGLLYACGHEIQKMSNRKFFKKAPVNQNICHPCTESHWIRRG